MTQYNVTGMSCAACSARVEKAVSRVPGVTSCSVSLLTNSMGVEGSAAPQNIIAEKVGVSKQTINRWVAEEAWETAEIAENELPQTASEFADIAVAQVNHYVNVRQEPDTESEILGKLYDKSAATVLETTEDGWYRITSGNVNGYVKAEYVVLSLDALLSQVTVSDAEVKTWYDGHKDRYEVPEERRASHILIVTNGDIDKEKAKAKADEAKTEATAAAAK